MRKEETHIETLERKKPLCTSGTDRSRYFNPMYTALPIKHYGSHDGTGFCNALSDSPSR